MHIKHKLTRNSVSAFPEIASRNRSSSKAAVSPQIEAPMEQKLLNSRLAQARDTSVFNRRGGTPPAGGVVNHHGISFNPAAPQPAKSRITHNLSTKVAIRCGGQIAKKRDRTSQSLGLRFDPRTVDGPSTTILRAAALHTAPPVGIGITSIT
jgi:hypothetical protein